MDLVLLGNADDDGWMDGCSLRISKVAIPKRMNELFALRLLMTRSLLIILHSIKDDRQKQGSKKRREIFLSDANTLKLGLLSMFSSTFEAEEGSPNSIHFHKVEYFACAIHYSKLVVKERKRKISILKVVTFIQKYLLCRKSSKCQTAPCILISYSIVKRYTYLKLM